jgi:hypothetical protein
MRQLLFILLIFSCRFTAAQERYAIIINELMIDPSPVVGLPGFEWLELRNVSADPVNLKGWRIGDTSRWSGPFPDIVLDPESFLIVCSNSGVAGLSAFGRTIGVTSFPSLDNDVGTIGILSSSGKAIHAVNYSSEWYGNELKRQGGWSLEMIDPHNPCSGALNWRASKDPNGGTPGERNSVESDNPDGLSPQLLRAYVVDEHVIRLVFDESVDSATAVGINNYSLSPDLQIQSIRSIPPLFIETELRTAIPMESGATYKIIASEVKDCSGNEINTKNVALIGIPVDIAFGDVVINEILFNPGGNVTDFIEVYNRSDHIVNAGDLVIANRSNGNIGSLKSVSAEPRYLFPGDHLAFTEELRALSMSYLLKDPEGVIGISAMPSFPDDKGTVVLLNKQGEIIDEVAYQDKWHFPLINNSEGVSLERIEAGGCSQDRSNWHSAASTVGYATPGYRNSQERLQGGTADEFEVTPATFSPDNDGIDDILFMNYKLDRPGYMCSITVFDATGRPARLVVRNALLEAGGTIKWNGLDEKEKALPHGIYIVFAEIFDLEGNRKVFKRAAIIAGRSG